MAVPPLPATFVDMALVPTTVFALPVVTSIAWNPNAQLSWAVVALFNALAPNALLWEPDVQLASAPEPRAEFHVPEVLSNKAAEPIPVLCIPCHNCGKGALFKPA